MIFPLGGLLLCKHVIELVVAERTHKGALVLAQDELGQEGRDAMSRDMLNNVDLLIETFNCILVSIFLELFPLPPER